LRDVQIKSLVKKHTKIYLEYFNFKVSDWIPCELCGSTAVDIHHIDARGMGGSISKDEITNLMALCRPCHIKYGDIKIYKEELKIRHIKYMADRTRLN
jgi:5-methylcytosine-specific restriction endonuclease McrA